MIRHIARRAGSMPTAVVREHHRVSAVGTAFATS
jgi:hypothetical protein